MKPSTKRTGWIEPLTLYLPVVIMGFLALGTWWLVRSSPQAAGLQAQDKGSAGPQYHIQAFSTQSFDAQGRLNAQVSAQFAKYDGQTDTLVMQQFRLRSVDEQGQFLLAQSDEARASNGLDRFMLLGKARVWKTVQEGHDKSANLPSAWVFVGDQLEYDDKAKLLRSQGPTRLQRDKDSLSAGQMVYDGANKKLSMQGQVRAVFHRKSP
jgi:lipopolysaccharide export system protein LptC